MSGETRPGTLTADGALRAINGALTAAERDEITAGFARANPHYDGLRADDVLSLLYDGDAHLDALEPFLDTNPDLAGNPAASFAALALIRLSRPLTRDAVTALIREAGLLREFGAPDAEQIAAELRRLEQRTGQLAATAAEFARPDLSGSLHLLAADLDRNARTLDGLAQAIRAAGRHAGPA